MAPMNSAYTLSEVLAAAYPKSHQGPFLVHAVDADGHAVCGRVRDEHLAEYADPRHTAPTCPHCLQKWR